MTPTEERLTAVLAETANTVREDTLRPLTLPRRARRRWPRALAPIAAAAAVVLVLGGEIVVEQLTGTPKAPSGAAKPPTIQIGKNVTGMAYDGANGTVYLSVTRYLRDRGHRGGFRPGGGTMAMVSAATCNAAITRGCAHLVRVPTGGRGVLDVAVNERTHTVYVLNNGPQMVTVLNADTCNASTTRGCSRAAHVRLPGQAAGLTVNPRTGAVYVPETAPVGMSVINGNTCDASDTSGCAAAPVSVSLSSGARLQPPSVAVDPGTDTVYLAVQDLVRVIDGRRCNGTDVQGCTTALATVGLPAYPSGMTIDPAAGTIYAASFRAMTVIGLKTCNALDTTGCAVPPATIRAGPGPGPSAADPATNTIYVASEPSSVSMVNSATCRAGAVSTCPEFPASFPVGSYPLRIAADPAAHTVYILGWQGGLSVVNAATCNATDRHGCPTQPAPRTPKVTPYTCDGAVSAYDSGAPAAPIAQGTVRVASGLVGDTAWSVWAKKGVIDPYGIEQGGLMLNGRWYALCDSGLSAGPDANFELIDAGAQGIVYGFIQHPDKVTIRLGDHRPQWTPLQVRLRGTTFFIFQLPRSACAYRGLAVNAWQGKRWGGYSNRSFGPCVPNQIVPVTVGRGSWGPQFQGQHW